MKSINEILGTVTTQNPAVGPIVPQANLYNTPTQGGPSQYRGISEAQPLCQKMIPWQREVYRTLENGSDIYVTASPGGGKTLPYTCYWLDHVLNLNTTMDESRGWNNFKDQIYNLIVEPSNVDKMLIMVPTRSLADQTVIEFRELFSRILLQGLSLYLDRSIINMNVTNNQGQVTITNRVREIIDAIDNSNTANNLLNARIQLYNNLSAPISNELRDPNDIHIANQIQKIDEQLNYVFMNGIRQLVERMETKGKSLICLRTGLNNEGDPKTAPVTIAIYESARNVIKDVKDKLRLVVTDESHLAQEREIRDDSRRSNIALALYEVLLRIKNVNTRLCFLSGTENPGSAIDLSRYIEKCFGRNMKVMESEAINQSNISIVPDDSISQERELLNIILKPRQSNNLIVLFSKNRIDKLTEMALRKSGRTTAFQIDRGQNQKYTFGGGVIGKKYSGFTKTPQNRYSINQQSRKEMSSAASRVPGASHIFDPVLREAINSGFGYIYRVDDKDPDQREKGQDALIVANLFKTGKIKTLLATDAVGIGVNIDVKTLYIPSVQKIQGGRFQDMKETELAQLLHRAGRGAFNFSTVVTPTANVPVVSNALSIGTSKFDQTFTIEYIPRLACASPKWFVSAWKKIYNAIT